MRAIAAFLWAAGLAVILTPMLGRVASAVGLVDRASNALQIHMRDTPFTGGIAVVSATTLALGLTGLSLAAAVGGAMVVALVTGLLDDAHPQPVWLRMVLLAGAGLLLAIPVTHGIADAWPVAGVVVIVLAGTNAVNLMDGQDGLAGGMAAIAALGLAGVAASPGRPEPETAGLALALAGALGGFLVWNRSPARVFLGNQGAYAVGAALAGVAVLDIQARGWRGFMGAGLCLAPFALELVLTVIRRLGTRTTVTVGDRLHSYDLLVPLLGGRARVTFAFWALEAAFAGLGASAARLPTPAAVALIASVAAAVGACVPLVARQAAAFRVARGARAFELP
jgi:UDP-GlcNAc:undecaprenyl-phosphate/decaprenyl-phosphate GlcNAc-1-phosphate transferase